MIIFQNNILESKKFKNLLLKNTINCFSGIMSKLLLEDVMFILFQK